MRASAAPLRRSSGRQLRALGERAQVLCVTHLAQVAAQAHSQFRVTKHSVGKITRTAVKTLSAAERVDEIARMLGGIDITDQARAHAREMLARGSAPRRSRRIHEEETRTGARASARRRGPLPATSAAFDSGNWVCGSGRTK